MPLAKANRSGAAIAGARTPAAWALIGKLGTALAALNATGHCETKMPISAKATTQPARCALRVVARNRLEDIKFLRIVEIVSS